MSSLLNIRCEEVETGAAATIVESEEAGAGRDAAWVSILAEGAIALSVTLSGGALFAS